MSTKKVLVICIAIFLIVAAVFSIFYYLVFILPKSPAINSYLGESLDNAFYDLKDIKDYVYYDQKKNEITAYLDGKSWNQEDVDDILTKNQKALEFFDNASLRSKFQDPESEDLNSPELGLNYSSLRSISRINILRGLSLEKKGNYNGAVEEYFKSLNLSAKINKSNQSLISYLVSLAIELSALDAIDGIVNKTNFDIDILKKYFNDLNGVIEGNKFGLKIALESEKGVSDKLLDKTKADAIREGQGNLFDEEKIKSFLNIRFYDDLISKSGKPCNQIKWDDYNQAVKSSNLNSIEEELIQMVINSLETLPNKVCMCNFKISSIRILIALKSYKSNNENLPVSLDNLVPGYLSEIPIDPFDGKNIRYDQKKQIIYSVGKDGIDSGGSNFEENIDDMLDPTIKINF